eukprot:TRINITY_DN7777_c0_g1_i1.p1 TRINITY_DN7777_c0_g1~~TRINITY_DN7777_c0_g1_i1.p1  ORF type:complete len:435 (-),score=61.27 TRINITY_DN7777_c0_g1_i1:102-1406(-)
MFAPELKNTGSAPVGYGAAESSLPQVTGNARSSSILEGDDLADVPLLLLLWLYFAVGLGPGALSTNPMLWFWACLYPLVMTVAFAVLSWGRSSAWCVYTCCSSFVTLAGLILAAIIHVALPPPSADTEQVLNADAVAMCVEVSLIFLTALLLLSRIMPRFGLRISGSSASFKETYGFGWYPEANKQLAYWNMEALNGAEKLEVAKCLLHHRCHWTGEPVQDYAFYIANEHAFIGCCFCHPLHPFDRFERVLLLVIQCVLITFPVAAFSVMFGEGALRLAIVFILVTGPRNGLKAYLKRIVVASDAAELDFGSSTRGRRSSSALWWEVQFLSLTSMFTVILCYICYRYVETNSERPVGVVLFENSDGLAFAFVLELLFELIIPRPAECVRGKPLTFGFFHQWCTERDFVRSGEQLSSKYLGLVAAKSSSELGTPL